MSSSYGPVRGASSISAVARAVRRHDPDRFLTALFAPPAQRETLLVLYAFNHELARARDVAHEPMVALMRLQWWREVVEGAPRAHELVTPLAAAIGRGELAPEDLLGMIEAREIETEPAIPTLAEWRAYLCGSAGGVAVAAGRLLGAPEPEALRPLGAAYGAAGVLRSVGFLAAQQRCLLPAEALAAHGLSPEAVAAGETGEALNAVIRDLVRVGEVLLTEGRKARLPRAAKVAALPAVLAARDLRRLPSVTPARGLGDRLAVARAALISGW